MLKQTPGDNAKNMQKPDFHVVHSSKYTDILSQEKAQGTDETELLSHISLKSETCCPFLLHHIAYTEESLLPYDKDLQSTLRTLQVCGEDLIQYTTRHVYDIKVSYNSTLFSQHKITMSKQHHILCTSCRFTASLQSLSSQELKSAIAGKNCPRPHISKKRNGI